MREGQEQPLSSSSETVLVSACLLGAPCRYDGSSRPCARIEELAAGRRVVPFCPECLGGLRPPRPPAEIQAGDGAAVLDGRARVIEVDGTDVTEQFVQGACRSVVLAKRFGAKDAILKAKSPSCGVSRIHDGSFSGALRGGAGVAAAALMREGIRVSEA